MTTPNQPNQPILENPNLTNLTDFGKSLVPANILIKCNAVSFRMEPLEQGSFSGKAWVILQRIEGDTVQDVWCQEFTHVSQRLGDTIILRLNDISLPINLQYGTGAPLIVNTP